MKMYIVTYFKCLKWCNYASNIFKENIPKINDQIDCVCMHWLSQIIQSLFEIVA